MNHANSANNGTTKSRKPRLYFFERPKLKESKKSYSSLTYILLKANCQDSQYGLQPQHIRVSTKCHPHEDFLKSATQPKQDFFKILLCLPLQCESMAPIKRLKFFHLKAFAMHNRRTRFIILGLCNP
eukprot:c17505_g2_i1 orf=2-379(-)